VDYGGGGGDGKTLISPPHFAGSGRPTGKAQEYLEERTKERANSPNAANLPI
jgi:hypothetical protein